MTGRRTGISAGVLLMLANLHVSVLPRISVPVATMLVGAVVLACIGLGWPDAWLISSFWSSPAWRALGTWHARPQPEEGAGDG
jgi:hypothetical protein